MEQRKTRYIVCVIGIICMLILLVVCCYFQLVSWLEGLQQTNALSNSVADFRNHIAATQPIYSTTPQIPQPSEDNASVTFPAQTEPEPYLPELKEQMEAYNQLIFETKQSGLVDTWSYQKAVIDLSGYGLAQDEIVGVISIPKINVEMPLYLGATDKHMAAGFAQLSQTSMPIGGVNTNCVVAGHRGWRGAAYMRDVDLLQIGDSVILENLWETLEYRVCEIDTIWPHEIEEILIQPGRDLLTIVTCTPYGVGTQRILVFCERAE